MPGYGRPKLVHSPYLVARSDGRYEGQCRDCRARAEEAIPIGIGLPVASRIEALEILRNHLGPVARRTGSQIFPAPQGPTAPATGEATGTAGEGSRSAGPGFLGGPCRPND